VINLINARTLHISMVGEEREDTIGEFVKILKRNALRILTALGEEDLKWKDLQNKTKIPVATLNRSLSRLRDFHLVSKEGDLYRLTWAGKLILDGLILLDPSLKGSRYSEEIDEGTLARDVVLIALIMLLAGLKRMGRIDIEEFEESLDKERKIIREIIRGFKEEGLLTINGNIVESTERFKELSLKEILSL